MVVSKKMHQYFRQNYLRNNELVLLSTFYKPCTRLLFLTGVVKNRNYYLLSINYTLGSTHILSLIL